MKHDDFSMVKAVIRTYVAEQIDYLIPFVPMDNDTDNVEEDLRKSLDKFAIEIADKLKDEIDEHMARLKMALLG